MKRDFFNKRGAIDFLSNEVVFIILMIVFVGIVIFSLGRIANGASLVEQAYAKKIALIIDESRPGTSIEVDINELMKLADKNDYERMNTVEIDNKNHMVTVRVTEGKGYSFNFFTDNVILWGVKKNPGRLKIEVKENVDE